MITTSSTSTPTVGRARSALATVTSQVALPVWPIHSPSGSAISSAITSAIAEKPTWAPSWPRMPVSKLVLCQWAGSESQEKMSPIMRAPPVARG